MRKPRPPKPKCPTEDADQVALAAWLDFRRVLWCHVPNGGHRHVAVAKKLKASGVKPGVPDCIIFTPPKKLRPAAEREGFWHPQPFYVGCALELKKTHGGKLSECQRRWLEDLSETGWLCIIAHGFLDAVAQLTDAGY